MSDQPVILAVDRNRRNLALLSQFLGREHYTVVGVATLSELDAVLDARTPLSLALLDLGGFDAEVWARCKRLRQSGVPFLIISARQSAAVQQASLEHGARGTLVKPLVVKDLLHLIGSMLGE